MRAGALGARPRGRVSILLPVLFLAACGQAVSSRTAPATVEEAAAVFDLARTDLVPGSPPPASRSVAGVVYEAAAAVPAAFAFHREQLAAAGWKEEAGGSVSDAMGSGVFTKEGYALSLTVMPAGGSGKSTVIVQNHGNVRPDSVPLPAEAKLVFATPIMANFSDAAGADEVRAAAKATLLANGWTPYGEAGDVRWFKKNAVRLMLNVMKSPAAGGTMIMVQSELLPADLPVPPDATRVDHATSLKRVDFTSPGSPEAVRDFYRTSAAGWTTGMKEPTHEDGKEVLAFRNARNDLITLAVAADPAGGTRATLELRTADEIAEMNRKLDAQAAAHKKAREEASGTNVSQ